MTFIISFLKTLVVMIFFPKNRNEKKKANSSTFKNSVFEKATTSVFYFKTFEGVENKHQMCRLRGLNSPFSHSFQSPANVFETVTTQLFISIFYE